MKLKIIIPKDFKSNFFKDNFTKPFSKLRNNIADYKEEKIKAVDKTSKFEVPINDKLDEL